MREVLQLLLDRMETPIGEMLLVADRDGNLRAVDWTDYEGRMMRILRLHYGDGGFQINPMRNPHGLADAMNRYFSGDLGVIDKLPVATAGTSFQRDVWQALRTIRCGEPISYAQLAERIGRPKAVRAVGLANGANPVGVVVPCHRVIGANGSLTGYGGGIERKRWLLEHEAGLPGLK
jgi:methylated-DNA-[protein]-cysteine S-methyltransferase